MTDPPDSQSSTLLEIYKLHARLADRVSQRREGANRLYAGMLTTFVAFTGALVRFGDGPVPTVLAVASVVGIFLSLSWYIVIRSYRQLNSGKFKALQEMEKELPYPFFKREWELLKEGKEYRSYAKLTVVETILPTSFLLLFFVTMIVNLCLIFCKWTA